jgi:hypothetical protein
MAIAKRFSPYLGMILGAALIYWLVVWVVCVALAKSSLGHATAQIGGALVATVLVVGAMVAYARWICTGLSKSRLVVDASSFTIAAQQKFRVNEHEFAFDRTARVVFGQPLDAMETLFEKVDQLGISRGSMATNKDLKAGRLFVYDINDNRTAFQFVDKAFTEADLLRFFAALKARGVSIEVGT